MAAVLLAVASASATQFWYDVMTNYPGGGISTNSGGLWFPHSPGSLTSHDALVVTNTYTSGAAVGGKRLRVNGLNSEYVERFLDTTTGGVTNGFTGGTLYASFIVSANFVPSAGAGTYFATFTDNGGLPGDAAFDPSTNGFQFRGRVFQIGNTNVFPFTSTVAGTYKFGVANAAGDPAQGGGPSILYVPIDLIKNIDYQVVLKYDVGNASATLWVNPSSESDTAVMAGPTSDSGAVANAITGLLFRQRTGGGTLDVRDVAVGDTFADVMTNAPGPVLVATNFNTVSSYSGSSALLEVFATSIGGGNLSYQWYQIAGGVTNAVGGNSQKYLVTSLSASDAGLYFCAITNAGGVGALSRTNFAINVNATPTAPLFTSRPPASTNGSVGGSLTVTCAAAGTGPLSFQWAFNDTPLVDGQPATSQSGDVSVVSGAQTPTLTITSLSTNETGNLTVTVTGGVAPTTNTTVAVTVNPARAVSIAYIRSLEDTSTWQVTDTASVFAITNAVVTMYTNVTSGTTASYYIQDDTGGLDLFVTGDASFRPQLGDIVNVSGTLSSFANSIELLINSSNPYQYYHIVGHTNVLPAPVVFWQPSTNSPGLMETNIEGKLIMLTNVWFTGALSISGNTTLVATNSSGMPFAVFFPGGTDQDVNGQTLPARFAHTITGVAAQFKSGSTYANTGYEIYVTRIGDVVTTPPPAVTVNATAADGNVVLTWPAVPYTPDTRGAYAYSVYAATDLNGPYLPLATGLTFNTTNGIFTDAAGGTAKFYKVSSP